MDKELLALLEKYKVEGLTNLSELCFLFKLRGTVFDMEKHYMFEPAFMTSLPKRSMWKLARQLGKTTNAIAAPSLLRSIIIPNWTSLVVAPLFEQSKRISDLFYNPLIQSSPFKGAFIDRNTQSNVLRKTMSNGSVHHFSYAYIDAERLRGIPGVDDWKIDEVQAMNWDFIPIIRETASASPFGFETFCGTPLTLDNTIERLWQEGTQSELCFRCDHCTTWNIPCIDQHLTKIIGKKYPICHKCGRKLNVYAGKWVSKFPDRQFDMVSRHMPQVTHPIHATDRDKWNDILYKINKYDKNRLYNEVFGESYDTSERIFSLSDVVQACKGGSNDLKTAMQRMSELHFPGLAVDWTGGGSTSESYTAVAAGGIVPGTDIAEVVLTFKIPKNYSPMEECRIILQLKSQLRARFVAHDYGGVGRALEALLLQMGCPQNELLALNYVTSPKKEIVYPDMINSGHRTCWNVDKMRSLVVLSVMLKAGRIVLPSWKTLESEDLLDNAIAAPGNPVKDFLNLCTMQSPSRTGSDIFYIGKTAGSTDDVAHSVNFLCTTLWNTLGRYPDVAEAMAYKLTKEQIEMVCPSEPNWDNTSGSSGADQR